MTGCILEALNVELPCLQYVVIVQTDGPLYRSHTDVTKHNAVPKLIIIHRNYKALHISQHRTVKVRLSGYFLNIHHTE